MRCLSLLLLVLTVAGPVSAAPEAIPSTTGGPRVRPADSRTATLLIEGLRRSPSLAGLVDRIEASDVIVYIEIQPTLRRHLAGCLTWMDRAGHFRYVRASLNGDLPPEALIAAIGHELRHVVEIVEHPDVVDEASLITLYRQIGLSGRRIEQLDTQAARDMGTLVRQDLRDRPAAAIPGPRFSSPDGWHAWYRQQRRAGV